MENFYCENKESQKIHLEFCGVSAKNICGLDNDLNCLDFAKNFFDPAHFVFLF